MATSSGEAEFLAAGSAANESLGIAGIFHELGFPIQVTLQLDSVAAIGMVQRRGVGRVRHLGVRFLHLQELLREGRISAIQNISTKENTADIGTKALTGDRLVELLDLFGYHNVEDSDTIASVQQSKLQNLALDLVNSIGQILSK